MYAILFEIWTKVCHTHTHTHKTRQYTNAQTHSHKQTHTHGRTEKYLLHFWNQGTSK
ncbi:hypothetical protein O3M35_008732 [Rhynocoris fuscipes]|uniref:Uncharacterized protein n=1 Tax=Rhynocoris fuscipes TaxID=488301 RepID=A0AAW1D7Y9_9HEMI